MAPQSRHAKQSQLVTRNGTLTKAETSAAITTEPAGPGTGKLKRIHHDRASTTSTIQSSLRRSPTSRQQDQKANGTQSPAGQSPSKLTGGIRSFFNRADGAAHDKRQHARPIQSHREYTDELLETISSDEDNSGQVALSKGSSTALAVRKRRFNAITGGGSATPEESSFSSGSQKFRRLDHNERASWTPRPTPDQRPWTDKFGPTSREELAVHRRKVEDVSSWLESAFRARRHRALIIKGPAGAGKTTTVKLVAKSLGVEAVEWTSPTSRDHGEATQSYSSQFEEFILRSGRMSGLTLTMDEAHSSTTAARDNQDTRPAGKYFLLIEDFPSTTSSLSNTVQSFRSVIAQHLAAPILSDSNTVPLVFVISETSLSNTTVAADSFTTHRLLGPELAMHPSIDTIEFNPVAPTFLLNALDQVILKEARVSGRRCIPGKALLKHLADFGDIRSAVSTLQFLLSRVGDNIWSGKVAFTKPKKKVELELTAEEKAAVLWITNRTSSLDIFHSVGKVVYNKRTQPSEQQINDIDPPPWLPQHRRALIPENDANELVTQIGTETSTFIAALHENYLPSCSNPISEAALDSVCGCVQNLSDSDLLCLDRFSTRSQYSAGSATDTLRQDEIAFQLGVRGVLFSLPTTVKRTASHQRTGRDAFRMFYPTSTRLWKHQAETNAALDSVLLALRALRAPAPVVDNMRERLYALAGVQPHAEISGESRELHSMTTSLLQIPKGGLMLECLSDLYSILQVREPGSSILAQLKRVIKMAGFADDDETSEDADENSQYPAASGSDQFKNTSTPAAGRNRSRTGAIVKARLPVDDDIRKLVLEDDDIEDD